MIKTNEDKLIKMSVCGEVSHPLLPRGGYDVGADGTLRVLPGVGGITFNCRVGDSAVGLAADHVEPAVSIRKPGNAHARENDAMNLLSCVGNKVRVVSGDAKGEEGVVTGKHGGIEHVIADFTEEVMKKMVVGDKLQIEALGAGFELTDYPGIKVMNCDPALLKAMKPKEVAGGKLEIPVAMKVPAVVMGSGLGHSSCYSGDYDIQLFDKKTVKEYGLDKLRLGDLVAIMDADNSYGRIFLSGAVSVGVVVHSDSTVSGHGPGVTTLLTSREGLIVPRVSSAANLVDLLNLKKKGSGKKAAKKAVKKNSKKK